MLMNVLLATRRATVVMAGGEPTVAVRGEGRGGRCSELAVRVARRWRRDGEGVLTALFGSSDGLDGNSGVAGVTMSMHPAAVVSDAEIEDAITRSATGDLVTRIGKAISLQPTGNNLRDLYVLIRSEL